MVKYQRKNLYSQSQWKKTKDDHFADEDEESCFNRQNSFHLNRRAKSKLLLPAVVFFCLVFFFLCTYSFSLLYSFGDDKEGFGSKDEGIGSLCSSVTNGSLCCDRRSIRSDICVMKGDVRTHSASSSILLYTLNASTNPNKEMVVQHEKIRPYTRKWETSVMKTIDELDLIVTNTSGSDLRCDVVHEVPAVFFSTGGYTGNLYHEFNDGILPLYITSQQFNKKVVFVILEYHNWWITKYGNILSQLSDFPAVDFSGDRRVHCFPEVIVGLKIHDELAIDSSLVEGNKTVTDFHDILDKAYWPRINGLIEDEERLNSDPLPLDNNVVKRVTTDRPKLAIMSRNGSRGITNEGLLVKMAEEIGFTVEVVRPDRTTELAKIYRVLNSSDVMIGVHGAAMTHLLFMKPGGVFIQIVPLGTDWAAETYYGEPARKFGLRYIGYKIHPRESSLYDSYDKNDPILMDPNSVTQKGWEFTKRIYLDSQTVRLDLRRFRKHLLRAYYYTTAGRNNPLLHESE